MLEMECCAYESEVSTSVSETRYEARKFAHFIKKIKNIHFDHGSGHEL